MATHALPKQGIEPEIKMEEQDLAGPEVGEGMQGAALPEIGSVKEFVSRKMSQSMKQEPDEGPSGNWDVQFQEFLKTLQAPQSGEESPQLPELRQWSSPETSPVSSREVADASKWPRGLWVSQSQPHFVEEVQQEQNSHLDTMHSGKGASGVRPGDAIRAEVQRLQFRQFCYQEADGPRETYLQLQELCCQWLKPERHTKEQILDQLILEQFLAILPQEMQHWLLEQNPETCTQAVALAEHFLLRQQEAKGWEQQITELSEEVFVIPPKAGEALPGNLKTHETKDEDGGNVILLGDRRLNKSKEQKALLESPGPTEPLRTSLETAEGNSVLSGGEADENQHVVERHNGKDNEGGDQAEATTLQGGNRKKHKESGESFGHSLRLLTYKSIHREEKLYKCWHCGKSFRSSSDLMTHERTHVGEKLYKCSHCGESERTHTGQKPHKCSHCGSTFGCNSQEGINLGEKPYTCSECGKSCSQRSDLLKHQRTHTGEKPCKCLACGKNFRNSSGLKVHQRIHTGEKPYKCSHCGKCFSWSSHFISHERIHSAFCSYCGKSFSQKTDLVEHERTHRAEDVFACFACGKSFDVSSELVTHARTHKEKPFECSVCGKTFRNSLQRIAHQKVHTGEKLHKCSHCGKSFSQRQSYITHERTHTGEKPHKCLVCGKSFRNIPNLKSHERTHTGEKPYKCSHCDKSFRWSSHLVLHERIHTGEKPYRCLDCGRTFDRRSNLLAHVRVHPGQKPYTCSECDKNFTSKSSLLRHQKSHVGQEMTTCSECGKVFRQRLNRRGSNEAKVSVCTECVRSHYLSSDLVIRARTCAEKKPFECLICGKTFRNSSHLITHQSVHTRVQPYQCSDCGRNFVRRPNLLAPTSEHGNQKPYKCSECEKSFS